jgi:hypothetical protein
MKPKLRYSCGQLQAELLQLSVGGSRGLQKEPRLDKLRPQPGLQAPAQRLTETG